eukprot:CAMPEP_0182518138 /NCGR_PEP_ID=MMETSP1321-20130603/43628_1 /TAXON_ID=91990 /ORGANISM="Bolidomonas sp., Strain RCC1657" /LENGTH=32 /DNA_ID= /DNA_START= /DNA_END= /DNA_ORIENTATION=
MTSPLVWPVTATTPRVIQLGQFVLVSDVCVMG